MTMHKGPAEAEPKAVRDSPRGSSCARDPSQAWFWQPAWLAGEERASADIVAGRVTRYDSDVEFFAALAAEVEEP